MLDDLSRIADELRRVGLPLSIQQQSAAAQALTGVDPLDREEVYAALAATLASRQEELPALLTVLDIFLASGSSEFPRIADADDAALHLLLRGAMRRFDKHNLQRIVAEAVHRHGGFMPGRAVGGTYYVTRTLRWMDLDQIERDDLPNVADGAGRGAAKELWHRKTIFVREAVDAVVRGLLVADLGAEELARLRRGPLLDDIDIAHASAEKLRQLERAIVPVARRMARKLRSKAITSVRPDLRQTFRRAMANGGIVHELHFSRRRRHAPRIIILADVSGSVASFAQFTIGMLRAVSQAFSRVQYFAFADGIADITEDVNSSGGVLDLANLLARRSGIVRADGRSDYGFAFKTLLDLIRQELVPETILLILGDGRNNYRAAGDDALLEISRKVASVHWLNPEPPENWDLGDSAVPHYRPHLSSIVACRNLGQLQRFIARVL